MKYKTKILSVSVYQEDENPFFGEGATHIRLDDEGAGEFIVMSQSNDNSTVGVVNFDPESWNDIINAVKTLLDNNVIIK